jgi:hypothetical protein
MEFFLSEQTSQGNANIGDQHLIRLTEHGVV